MEITADNILARKEQSLINARERTDKIEVDFRHHKPRFNKNLQEIAHGQISKKKKVIRLQQFMLELREYAKPHTVACKKGCALCCYQRVVISQTEADAIGEAIGRRAKILPLSHRVKPVNDYGKDTPCTFLVNNECSIYDQRPFLCRSYINLDDDALLCSFENWELHKKNDPRSVGIPLLGHSPAMDVYGHVCQGDVYGDIREFFPSK